MKLQITDDSGRVVAEGELVVGGLLFLVSGFESTSVVSLNLVDMPEPGGLVYATFKRKRFGFRCIPIQSSVNLEPARDDLAKVQFTIGSQKYIASRIKKRLSIFHPMIIPFLLGVFLILVVSKFIEFDELFSKSSRPNEWDEGVVVLVDKIDVDTPFDLAKRYIRSGSEQQARMSLFEVVEGDDEDERASRVLDGMDGGREGEMSGGSEHRNIRAFFDDGVGMKVTGNYLGALKSFNSALKMVGDEVHPSYYDALVMARNDVKRRVVKNYELDVKRAHEIMEGVVDREPLQVIEELSELRERMRSVESIFPEEKYYISAGGEVESMIDSITVAWMDGAISSEYLSSCFKALPIYSKIALSLKSIRPRLARRAGERALLCSKGGSR